MHMHVHMQDARPPHVHTAIEKRLLCGAWFLEIHWYYNNQVNTRRNDWPFEGTRPGFRNKGLSGACLHDRCSKHSYCTPHARYVSHKRYITNAYYVLSMLCTRMQARPAYAGCTPLVCWFRLHRRWRVYRSRCATWHKGHFTPHRRRARSIRRVWNVHGCVIIFTFDRVRRWRRVHARRRRAHVFER